MSIKVINGLGTFGHPFDVESHSSQAVASYSSVLASSQANILVDHVAKPPLGNMGNPSTWSDVFPGLPTQVPFVVPPAPLAGPIGGDPSAAGRTLPQFSLAIEPATVPQILSNESGLAAYDTFFGNFDLEALPFYNFWVPDEETNDTQGRGDRKLEDIPRFVKVAWNPAPDVPARLGIYPKSAQFQNDRRSVKFGLETEVPTTVASNGLTFSPDHLRNFSLVKQSTANGYVSPGTVHSVVSMPVNTALFAATAAVHTDEPAYSIDDDLFLVTPEFDGISLQELRSNIHTVANGTLNSGRLSISRIESDFTDELTSLFSGKFSVEKPTENGGNVLVQSTHGSPTISFRARTAISQEEDVVPDPLFDFARRASSAEPSRTTDDMHHIRANFVHPTIGGILDETKASLSQRPEHLETAVGLSQLLPSLEVLAATGIVSAPRAIAPPTFPSPAQLPFLEYCGYVIEKYMLGDDGSFAKVDEIDLPSREYSEYIDTKVLYSGVYRYRIRAYLRWTTDASQGIEGFDPTLGGGLGSQTKSFSNFKSTYFHTEWSKEWAYGLMIDTVPPSPPDELTVRPDSSRRRIVVTFKVPFNEQRDIVQMRLYRKIQDADGQDLTDWNVVGPTFSPNMNALYFDTDVEFFQNNPVRYVYAAQMTTRHDEDSPLSTQLGTRLNSDYVRYGEYPVEFVSQEGVRIEHHGAFATYPFRRTFSDLIVPNGAILDVSGRSAVGSKNMDQVQYYLRFESLDTGEKKDVPVLITYDNQAPLVLTQKTNVFVSLKAVPSAVISAVPGMTPRARGSSSGGHTQSGGHGQSGGTTRNGDSSTPLDQLHSTGQRTLSP